MIEICQSVRNNCGHYRGLVLVFRNAFIVKIILSMPYLIIIEIISLGILEFKPECRNTVHGKIRMVRSACSLRLGPGWISIFCKLEWEFRVDTVKRFTDLFKIIIHCRWYCNSDRYCWSSVTVKVIGYPVKLVLISLHPVF